MTQREKITVPVSQSFGGIQHVAGLPDAESKLLYDLVSVWRQKYQGNVEKIRYYEMKNRLRDLGIAIPTPLRNIDLVVGWPAKAVDSLAIRSRFDGFVFEDGTDHGLKAVLDENSFGLLYRQAVTDQLVNACSFITITRGGSGEPDVVLSAYSAIDAAALWDRRRKRIKAGIAIVDVRETETSLEPTWVNLFTDTDIWEIRKIDGTWSCVRSPHKMGRPLMEPLAYKSNTTYRPFGRSRINHAVMCITDSALRANLRSEVAAEFAASVQKYVLGVDSKDVDDGFKLEAYMGNVIALGYNEEGEIPHVGQFPQVGTQPQIDHMRQLAAQFSGETSIPISELGIVHDNPISQEALITMYSSLITECEDLNDRNSAALKTVGKMIMASLGDKSYTELDENEMSISCHFKDPSLVNSAAKTDALLKKVSMFPWLAETDVALEEAGYREDERTRLKADKAAYQARQVVANIREQMENDNQLADEGVREGLGSTGEPSQISIP